MTFEAALISVWRQSLVDNASSVELDGQKFPVRTTAKQKLKQVDFLSKAAIFAVSNKTPAQSPAGQNSPVKAKKSCSSWEKADM